MPAAEMLTQERSWWFKEGSYLYVTGTQSVETKLNRENLCRFDINQSFDTVGFPLKVEILVEHRSSSLTPCCIAHHQTEKTFWIPHDDIFSNDARDIVSKILFLINVPFSLDYRLTWTPIKWRGLRYVEAAVILENRDTLISTILESARSMKDCPSLPPHKEWLMTLEFRKVTYLPDVEFTEMVNKVGINYNIVMWLRTQRELDSRIVAILDLQKEVGIKKVIFEVGESKHSNFLDMCSICREEFSAGSIVSCLSHCCHVYHEFCILEWLLRNRSCPYCRSELAKKV